MPLSTLGEEQALAIRERLRDTPPELFVCSRLLRARQTAAPTLAIFPSIPVETWPIGEFGVLATSRWVNTTNVQRRPWRQEYWDRADPHFVDGEGAESFSAFIARVCATYARLETFYREGRRSIVIFGHGQFFLGMRWLVQENIKDITPEGMQALHHIFKTAPFENGAGFTAIFDGRSWSIGQEA